MYLTNNCSFSRLQHFRVQLEKCTIRSKSTSKSDKSRVSCLADFIFYYCIKQIKCKDETAIKEMIVSENIN